MTHGSPNLRSIMRARECPDALDRANVRAKKDQELAYFPISHVAGILSDDEILSKAVRQLGA